MTKQEFLNTVLELNAKSVEVFTDMVNRIEEPVVNEEPEMLVISKQTFRNLLEEIVGSICNEGMDVVEDFELSLTYGNQVELDDVTLSEYKVREIVEAALESYLEIKDAE